MDKSTSSSIIGIIAMILTAFLWSIAGLFIKMIDWNPFLIAGFRSAIASIVILIYLRKPAFPFSSAQIAAGIANSITMIFFISANKMTTATNAIVLQYIAPIITAFLSVVILKERTYIEHWIAMVFIAFGMIFMFMDKLTAGSFIGNMVAVVSGLSFSFYFVFMRLQKDGSPLESILISHLITVFFCLILLFYLDLPHFTVPSVFAILVLGIFQIGFSSLLFAVAIRRISAVSANLIAVIEPVFNPVWVYMVLGEKPGINAIIGGIIIVIAVTGASVISVHRLKAKIIGSITAEYESV